jgi:putative transposase
VSKIKAVIAELATYGYRRVAVLKRQALAAGLKPPNHKRVYRVMKVHGLLLDRHVGGDERRHDGRIAVDERNRRWCSDGLRSAATTASGCGLRLRSTAVIGKP